MKLRELMEGSIDKIDKTLKKELKSDMKHIKHFYKGVKKGKTNDPRFKKQLDKNIEKEIKFVIDLLNRGMTSWLGVDLKALLNKLSNENGNAFINQYVSHEPGAIRDLIIKLGGGKYLEEPEDYDYDDDDYDDYENEGLLEGSIDKIDKTLKKELKSDMKHIKHFYKGVKKGKTNNPRFKKQLDKNIEKEIKFVIDLLNRGMTSWLGVDLKALLNKLSNENGNAFINQYVSHEPGAIRDLIIKLGGGKYLEEPEDYDYDDDYDE